MLSTQQNKLAALTINRLRFLFFAFLIVLGQFEVTLGVKVRL